MTTQINQKAVPEVDLEKLTYLIMQSSNLANRRPAEVLDSYLRIYNELATTLEEKQKTGNWFGPTHR